MKDKILNIIIPKFIKSNKNLKLFKHQKNITCSFYLLNLNNKISQIRQKRC